MKKVRILQGFIMNRNYVFFTTSIFIVSTIFGMDLPYQIERFSYKVPSLHDTIIEAVTTGYGKTEIECKKNSAQLITALQKKHENCSILLGYDTIEKCKNRYIGLYGWRASNLSSTNSHPLNLSQLLPYDRDKDLYIINDGKEIYLFDMKEHKKERIIAQPKNSIQTCTTARQGQIIILATWSDSPISLWNTKTNKLIYSQPNVSVLDLASDDNVFASSDVNENVKIWDISSGKCLNTYVQDYDPMGTFDSLAINNGILYAGETTQMSFFEQRKSKIVVFDSRLDNAAQTWMAHKKAISCFIFSKKNSFLMYSGSKDHSIKQWDIRNTSVHTKKMNLKHATGYKSHENLNVHNIYESSNGKKVFATDMNRLLIWDISQQEPQLTTKIYLHSHIIKNSMYMNKNETKLYIGTNENSEKYFLKTISPSSSFENLIEMYNQEDNVSRVE